MRLLRKALFRKQKLKQFETRASMEQQNVLVLTGLNDTGTLLELRGQWSYGSGYPYSSSSYPIPCIPLGA